jgi:nitrate/nitrite transport system substrate-binding protein
MMFSGRNCNYPQPKFVKWWLSQFRRWGMVEGTPDYDGVAKATAATALYEEAMKEIGYTGGKLDDSPETFMDGAVFDPAKAEEFATSAAIKNLKG